MSLGFPATVPVTLPVWFLFVLALVPVTTPRNGFRYSPKGFPLPLPPHTEVGWVGLVRFGLGLVGLGWVGLGWLVGWLASGWVGGWVGGLVGWLVGW